MAGRRLPQIVITLVKIAVVAACFAGICVVIWRNLEGLRDHEFTLRPLPLLASLPVAVVYLLGRALIWHRIVRRLIGHFPLRTDLLSWLSSLLGKYLPGKVFTLLGRVYFYRDAGAGAAHVGFGYLIEAVCSGLAALLIFGLALLWRPIPALASYTPALACFAAVLLVGTHPAVLRVTLNTALRIIKRPTIEIPLRWRDVFGWTLLLAANWLILGAGFMLLLWAVIDIPAALYPFLTGSLAMAGIIGMLALFTPSGLGVREGVLTIALSAVLPVAVAAVVAIMARIWMTMAEGSCGGIALWMSRGVRATARDPSDSMSVSG